MHPNRTYRRSPRRLAGFVMLLAALPVSIFAQSFLQESPEATKWVDHEIRHMSRKQQIAQLMVIRVSTIGKGGAVFMDDKVSELIRKYRIGALCQFQGAPGKQVEVLNRLQHESKVPLLVCIDGETGLGMRYDSVMKFPDQLTLGAMQGKAGEDIVSRIGLAIAAQCRRAGIQVDYAPVVDINNNPANPVINFRSFGQDKYQVARYGTAMMKGMQDGGIMATAKHFPGHGDVSVDSHKDLPVIHKSMAGLDSLELYPFRALVKAGVGAVMVAHLSIPAIDSTPNKATSISYNNVTGLLRNELGFRGITFTDALGMKGVSKFYPQGAAAAESLVAGNDMLCLPEDVKGAIKQVRKAVRHDRLSWKDIKAKARKVLLAKYNLGLASATEVNATDLTADLNKDVPALKREAYRQALTVLRLQNRSILPGPNTLKDPKVAFVGIGLTGPNHFSDLVSKTYGSTNFYIDYGAGADRVKTILDSLREGFARVIIGVHRFAKYPANNFGISAAAASLMQQLGTDDRNMILVFGNPYAVANCCDTKNLLACYEDDPIMHETAIDFMTGRINAAGRLPVTVCDQFAYGSGIDVAASSLTAASSLAAVPPAAAPLGEVRSEGFDEHKLLAIDTIAAEAIAKHATPGCVVLAARGGKILFEKAYGHMSYDDPTPITTQTVFDLASVTKISATLVSVMKLYEQGKIDIDKTLGDYLPWLRGSDKAPIKLRDVLLHQSGLVSFIPFYRATIDTATGIPKPGYYSKSPDATHHGRVAEHMYIRDDWRDTMDHRILTSKLGPVKYVYSDNNFILLGKIVEAVSGKKLDVYAHDEFYGPLGMTTTGYHPRDHLPLERIAPTEDEKSFRLQHLRGDVHDPGSAMYGGVAGHAGLFSDIEDLSKLYRMLLNGGVWEGRRYLKKETIDYFNQYHSNISSRGLGFEKPDKDLSKRRNSYTSHYVSSSAFGHTGYTGIGVWADPKYDLLYIFMSNRVNPDGGANLLLSTLSIRARIQDAIYRAMEK